MLWHMRGHKARGSCSFSTTMVKAGPSGNGRWWEEWNVDRGKQTNKQKKTSKISLLFSKARREIRIILLKINTAEQFLYTSSTLQHDSKKSFWWLAPFPGLKTPLSRFQRQPYVRFPLEILLKLQASNLLLNAKSFQALCDRLTFKLLWNVLLCPWGTGASPYLTVWCFSWLFLKTKAPCSQRKPCF